MRIVILTQDDPFYLGRNIDYLLKNLPTGVKVVGCCVFDVSPFGKTDNLARKAYRTIRVFGPLFFLRYGLKYITSRVSPSCQVKYVLRRHDIPLVEISSAINDPRSLAAIKAYRPDLLVSIAGNQIFRKDLIELAPKGCINLHTALLPKYRGLMPSFWSLLNEERYTGVSVFFVDQGIDSGPIIIQRALEIDNHSLEELILATKKMGMDCIIRALDDIQQDAVVLKENDDSQMTYYSFPTASDVAKFRKIGKRFY